MFGRIVAGVCSHCRYHIGLRYDNSQWRWPSTSQVLDPTGYDVTFLSSTFNLCATISFSSFTGIKVLDSPCDFGGVVPALCEVPLGAATAWRTNTFARFKAIMHTKSRTGTCRIHELTKNKAAFARDELLKENALASSMIRDHCCWFEILPFSLWCAITSHMAGQADENGTSAYLELSLHKL